MQVTAIRRNRNYVFHLMTFRPKEMVSDMVRYTKIPFCGLKPFLRMAADVAKAWGGLRGDSPAIKIMTAVWSPEVRSYIFQQQQQEEQEEEE